MDMEKKSPLRDVMNSTMEKVREMVDANNIVGAPITTPDGVTLIPISRVSFGFGSGGGDYGKPGQNNFGGGGGAGVKIDPVAFLVIKDGTTRVMPVAVPPVSTVDRIVDMAPDIVDKIGKFFDKKTGTKRFDLGILKTSQLWSVMPFDPAVSLLHPCGTVPV